MLVDNIHVDVFVLSSPPLTYLAHYMTCTMWSLQTVCLVPNHTMTYVPLTRTHERILLRGWQKFALAPGSPSDGIRDDSKNAHDWEHLPEAGWRVYTTKSRRNKEVSDT